MVVPRRSSPEPSTGTFSASARRNWRWLLGLFVQFVVGAVAVAGRWWSEGHQDAARVAAVVLVGYILVLGLQCWRSSHEMITIAASVISVSRPWGRRRSVDLDAVQEVVAIERLGSLPHGVIYLLDETGDGLLSIRRSLYEPSTIESLISTMNKPTARYQKLSGSDRERLYPRAVHPQPVQTTGLVVLIGAAVVLSVLVDLSPATDDAGSSHDAPVVRGCGAFALLADASHTTATSAGALTGVPLPAARPADECEGTLTGATHIVGIRYHSVDQHTYERTLVAKRWVADRGFQPVTYESPDGSQQISVETLDDFLYVYVLKVIH